MRGMYLMKLENATEGIWEKGLKLVIALFLALIVPHITWVGWATKSILKHDSFIESSEQFTQADGRALERQIHENRTDIKHIKTDLQEIKADTEKILEEIRESKEL